MRIRNFFFIFLKIARGQKEEERKPREEREKKGS
jgi:hypothetical protein